MSVKSILQTNDLVEVLGAARLEMAEEFGDGPYIIEFTEESDEQLEQIRELPSGGLIGQVLAKKSNNDYDVEWIDVGGGEGIAGVASFNGRTGAVVPQKGDYTAEMIGAVSTTTTINGKALNGDIILTASDIGAISENGIAAAATKLATARTIRTSLSSTSTASFDGTANIVPGVTGTLGVSNGGTGLTSIPSGSVLVGNGTSIPGTRAITNNTSTTSSIAGSSNLITMNTLRYALNRTTGANSSDTNYSTPMVRAIYAGTNDLVAGSSSLTSGVIYLVYE